MQFEFTEEQRMIASMLEEYSRAEGTSENVRAAMASKQGYLSGQWQSLSSELGLCGLMVPESAGGQGLSMIEIALVFEQLGKTLLPSPLLSTAVMSVAVLKQLDHQPALARIAAGGVTCAVCRVSEGSAEFVLDAANADLLLVEDAATRSISLLEAETAGTFDGLTVTPVDMIDQTRRLAHVLVDDADTLARAKITEGDQAVAAIDFGFNLARIALAAEAVGAAQECLARTVEYARERVQFGRAIGSFQAVKHQLADMMVANEAAISAVYFAACAVSEDPAQAATMAALAKVQASEALSFSAARMIQLHGGIGVTWEHDAHLYFKRARSTSTLFGLNADLDELIAHEIGLEACV